MERIGFIKGTGHAGLDMRHQIQTHQIHQAKDTGFGNAERATNDAVGFFDSQSPVHGFDHGGLNPVDTKAVGDKARFVMADDTGLAQFMVGKFRDHIDDTVSGDV